jgi:ribose/xylose/arabinose/galactoside ABC-type transport system permease subunit
MASARPVTTNRGVQFSVGTLHVLFGVVLALFMNHYARDFSLLAHERYDSYWMPLWVACLTYAFEAMLVRLPAGWLYGLLITALPYGWYAALVTVLYFENRSETTTGEYLRIAVPAILLGLSGGILNPFIAWLVSRARRDRKS